MKVSQMTDIQKLKSLLKIKGRCERVTCVVCPIYLTCTGYRNSENYKALAKEKLEEMKKLKFLESLK